MSIRELSLYLVGFFGAIAFSHIAARADWSWPAAIRFLASIAGA